MDMMGLMNAINKCGKYLVVLIVLANLMSISFADGETNIRNALSQLCNIATAFLAGSVVVLIILAAAVYGIGQIMGAETRARASVWATAMLTGAVIAIIIYVLTPLILQQLVPGGVGQVNIGAGGDPCAAIGGTSSESTS